MSEWVSESVAVLVLHEGAMVLVLCVVHVGTGHL